MHDITDIETLEAIYGAPSEAAVIKVVDRLTAPYRRMIEASPFVLMATAGPEGLDCSPRGDAGPVVEILDDTTLLLPDWHGNNRVDSLRNIVRDPRIGLLFLIPGSGTTMRVNGRAVVSVDPALKARLARDGKEPRTVIVITLAEVYSQCARAVVRSGLWDVTRHRQPADLPSVGDMLAAVRPDFDGKAYDAAWAERARTSLW